VATTGRLTAAQRTAIQAGNAVRQEWSLFKPDNPSHSSYTEEVIDSGIFPNPDDRLQRVIRAGQRRHVVWNPSPQVSVKPVAIRYVFVCDNSDGRLYENTVGGFFFPLVAHEPQECYIRHRVSVAIYSSSGTTWSEIEHMTFFGSIISLRHEDTGNSKKQIVPATTTITCEQRGGGAAFRRVWTEDDGIDVAMTNGVTADYQWEVT